VVFLAEVETFGRRPSVFQPDCRPKAARSEKLPLAPFVLFKLLRPKSYRLPKAGDLGRLFSSRASKLPEV
jgi:hypothetical protein